MGQGCTLELEQILDFVDGRLGDKEQKAVEEHVATACPDCASRLAWATDLVSLMRTDRLVDAPAAAVRHARNLMPKTSLVAGLGKLVATLVFDSSTQLRPVGVRGSALGTRRRMYEVGDTAVLDIQEEPLESGFTAVEGQVHFKGATRAEGSTAQIDLLRNNVSRDPHLETPANSLGEFSFTQVPLGDYALSIFTSNLEIVIPHLDL